MSFRLGVVVATHPEDHSVDLVMTDDGKRLSGVQVAGGAGASTRTGSIDLPHVPEKKNKWDITEQTDQEMIALVGYVGRQPVVMNFLYPQINQVLSKDPKRKVYRHQSDFSYFIDGDGNMQVDHPSGLYVRMGEAPDREETAGKNADANAAADRNTSKRVNIRIGLADGKGEITITPEGKVRFEIKGDYEIENDGHTSVKSKGDVTVETEANASVKAQGTAIVESTGPATMKAPNILFNTPSAHFTGSVTSDGDMIAQGVSQVNHEHGETMPGPGTTGKPIPGSS